MTPEPEDSFPCFGSSAALHVGGRAADGTEPVLAIARGRAFLEEAHRRLSRFREDSELSRLNRDPRTAVPVSPLLRSLAEAALEAGRRSGGLVDATLLDPLERAGYRWSLRDRRPLPLDLALASPVPRTPARPAPNGALAELRVDGARGTISRPPGLRLDGGGIAKGMAADLLAATLSDHPTFAVDCCGDIRLGGSAGRPRLVHVSDPFGTAPLRSLRLTSGAVATSGIGNRSWVGEDGAVAHHLLDPSTGRPAFTGVVQATALAPTALLAEVYAKCALLAGPDRAAEWLPHGGVVVDEESGVVAIDGEEPLEVAEEPR